MKKQSHSKHPFICYILIASIGFQGNSLVAQDIHFSQFSASPSTLNPASAGVFIGNFRVAANYKDQWRSIQNPYKTISGSFDMPFYKDLITNGSLGFGVSFISDKAGDLDFGTTQFNLSISANKSLNKNNNFSLGLQGGFAQRGIDESKQQWENQYDPSQTEGHNTNTSLINEGSLDNFSYGDFAAGLLWNYISKPFRANAGLALFHLNQPKQSFYDADEKLYSKLVFHGGGKININNQNLSVLPGFLLLLQGPSHEVNVGAMLKYLLQESSKYTGEIDEAAVYFGGWYRFADAFIINARVDYKNFALGVSYDVNISKLKIATASKGGIEFSLMYVQPLPASRKTATPLM